MMLLKHLFVIFLVCVIIFGFFRRAPFSWPTTRQIVEYKTNNMVLQTWPAILSLPTSGRDDRPGKVISSFTDAQLASNVFDQTGSSTQSSSTTDPNDWLRKSNQPLPTCPADQYSSTIDRRYGTRRCSKTLPTVGKIRAKLREYGKVGENQIFWIGAENEGAAILFARNGNGISYYDALQDLHADYDYSSYYRSSGRTLNTIVARESIALSKEVKGTVYVIALDDRTLENLGFEHSSRIMRARPMRLEHEFPALQRNPNVREVIRVRPGLWQNQIIVLKAGDPVTLPETDENIDYGGDFGRGIGYYKPGFGVVTLAQRWNCTGGYPMWALIEVFETWTYTGKYKDANGGKDQQDERLEALKEIFHKWLEGKLKQKAALDDATEKRYKDVPHEVWDGAISSVSSWSHFEEFSKWLEKMSNRMADLEGSAQQELRVAKEIWYFGMWELGMTLDSWEIVEIVQITRGANPVDHSLGYVQRLIRERLGVLKTTLNEWIEKNRKELSQGLSYSEEAKIVCKKIVAFFSWVSRSLETPIKKLAHQM